MSLWKRAKASVAISRKAEEALYGRALDEFDAGDIRRGLWAQALSHAGGDESQAKGVYLRLRVRSMIDDGAIVDSLVPEAKKDSAEEIEVTTEAASSGQGAWWVVVAVFAGFVLVAGAYLWPRMAAKREASKSSSEKAPPCISGEPSCAPWERDWGKRQMPAGAEITEDGIIIGCEIYWNGKQFVLGSRPDTTVESLSLTAGGVGVRVSLPPDVANRLKSMSESEYQHYYGRSIWPAARKLCNGVEIATPLPLP